MRRLLIGLASLTLAVAGCGGKKQAPQAPGNTGTAADPAATPTKQAPPNPCEADDAEGTGGAPPSPDGADPCGGGE